MFTHTSSPVAAAASAATLQLNPAAPVAAAQASKPQQKLWRQTFALENAQGETEAFSIGPDSCVWHFYPEVEGGGYRLDCLHLAAEAVSASLAPDGRLYVFACRGMSVTYVVESRDGKGWSAPMRAALPSPGEGFGIKRLQADCTQSGILLTVFADLDKPALRSDQRSATEVAMSFTLWTQGATASRPMPPPSVEPVAEVPAAQTRIADYRYTAEVPLNFH
jgi:hypothetical protein